MACKRIGLIGFGYIGKYIYRQIADGNVPGAEPAFVWNRNPARIEELPADIVLDNLEDFADRHPDLIVEMAHPQISAEYGEQFLAKCNYMMLSVTAMARDSLAGLLIETAERNRTSLFIPHGALVGVDNLRDGLDNWSEITITFHKHPDSLDLSRSGIKPEHLHTATVVFDGSVREAAEKFPRNVNTMATCALATLGFDKTRAKLIADPSLSSMSAEVTAIGRDGSLLETRKVEPAAGVSGQGMLASQLGSLRRAVTGGVPGINFV